MIFGFLFGSKPKLNLKPKMEVELEKLDLALQVKEAYYNILIADKAVEVAEKDVVSRKSNVEVVQNFYHVGMIPINDLLKAEVELANSQQNLVKALNAALLGRAAFNTVLSRDIHAPVEVKDIPGFRPEKEDFEAYQEQAMRNRPEMKLINIGILRADQEIRLALSKFYPEIGVTFDYIKEGDEPDVSGSPFHESSRYEIGAALTWTFWEWGKTYFSVREKMSLKKELIQTKKALEDSILLELKDAVLGLRTAEENIPTTKKAVKQGEENLRVNEERYKAQVTTITEVLDAQIKTPQEIDPQELQEYSLIGFGSGIYGGKHHKFLLDLADKLPQGTNKNVFLFSTCTFQREVPNNHSVLRKKLQSKGYTIIGEFGCRGFNTNSFSKYFGGVNKKRPNAEDLKNAEKFAQNLLQNL